MKTQLDRIEWMLKRLIELQGVNLEEELKALEYRASVKRLLADQNRRPNIVGPKP